MLNGRTSGARVARYAVVVAVLAVLAAAVVLAWSYLGGDRPEEDVARGFLTAFFAGEGERAYDLTTPGYRSVVFREELAMLADEVAGTAGDDVAITVLGSERTPGSEPLESLVGYTARTAVGRAEGVVTLFRMDDGWRVADVGYGFPEASARQLEDLRDLTRRLNEQLEQRVGERYELPAPSPAGS